MKNCRLRKARVISALALYFLLIQYASIAQISFESSEFLFEKSRSHINTVIACDDSYIFMRRQTALKEFVIDQFDHNLRLIQSKKMELTQATRRYSGLSFAQNLEYQIEKNRDKEELKFSEFYHTENGNITFFFTLYQNGILYLNKADLNKETLNLDNETSIHTIDIEKTNDYSGTFSKSHSPDSSKICIYSIHKKGIENRVHYLVFDRKYKLLNEGLHTFKRLEPDYELRTKCLINNQGDCTFSITEKYGYYADNRKKDKRDLHQLIRIDSQRNLLVEKVINNEFSLKNRNLISMKSRISNDGLIICSGVYSNDSEMRIDGVFYIAFSSENLALKRLKFNDISREQKKYFLISKDVSVHKKEIKKDAKTQKRIKKNKALKLPRSFELLRSISGSEKSTYLISTYIEKVLGTSNSYDTYQNGDFVIIKLDSLGKIEWITNIDRYENYLPPIASTPYLEEKTNGVNLFYTVWGKNYGSSRKIYYPISLNIDSKGKIHRHPKNNSELLNIGEVYLRPILGYKMTDTELLLFGSPSNRKGGKLIKFTLN